MAKKAKHSKAEIAAKLAQAGDLATQGKLQSEIARTLGVSVMTLHRWRKTSLPARAAPAGLSEPSQLDRAPPPPAGLPSSNSKIHGCDGW